MPSKKTPAGFVPRLVAYLIDLLIVGIVLGILRTSLSFLSAWYPGSFLFQEILFTYSPMDILFYLLKVLYFVLLTYDTGSTLGKKCMKLTVLDKDGNKATFISVLYRETVGRYLSGLLLNIGYLMCLIDADKRTFADYLSDTRVVYALESDVPAAPAPDVFVLPPENASPT